VAAADPFVIASAGLTHDGAGMATRIKSTAEHLYEQDFYA
jgi:hypothetical protein